MTDTSRKTPAQKAWATAHNTNEHYVDSGPLTDHQRTQRFTVARVGSVIRCLDGHMASCFAELGLADQHQDVMQRMELLLAAVRAAGEE